MLKKSYNIEAPRLFQDENESVLDIKNQEIHNEVDEKAEHYWNACLKIFKDNVSKQVFKTWFLSLKPLKWENNVLTVKVPSQFFCEWIEDAIKLGY